MEITAEQLRLIIEVSLVFLLLLLPILNLIFIVKINGKVKKVFKKMGLEKKDEKPKEKEEPLVEYKRRVKDAQKELDELATLKKNIEEKKSEEEVKKDVGTGGTEHDK